MLPSRNARAHVTHSELPQTGPDQSWCGAAAALQFLVWLQDALQQELSGNVEEQDFLQALQGTWHT